MNKIYKVLGKKGVVVIPYELREKLDLNYNDVISFTPRRDGSIVIRKEGNINKVLVGPLNEGSARKVAASLKQKGYTDCFVKSF